MTPRKLATRITLTDIFTRHDRAFLLFSGAKDSLALPTLCEPWCHRLALLSMNTGAAAPFMRDHVLADREERGAEALRQQR